MIRLRPLLLAAALVWLPAVAQGELFILENGGTLRGEVVNKDEIPRETYEIETALGGRIVLNRDQVRQVTLERPVHDEYERLRPTFPDTVEGQWELAEWCRERHLHTQRKIHLERIIELEPDHEKARRALGFTQHGGEWKTQEQVMAERGYVRYGGRWRTPQEIKLLEERRKIDLSQKAWFRELKRLRSDLEKPDKWRAAADHLRKIDDPYAVKALKSYFEDEAYEDVRVLYIEALANIDTPAALGFLADVSLEDDNQEVRLTALDYLKKEPRPNIVKRYISALGSKDNHMINRAAVGLANMGDKSAVGPLIDKLITTHKYKVVSGSPGISTAFGTGPGGAGPNAGGFPSVGGAPGGISVGQKTQVFSKTFRNQPVLDALVALTDMNFGFDPRAWKAWHATVNKPVTQDVRRDDK